MQHIMGIHDVFFGITNTREGLDTVNLNLFPCCPNPFAIYKPQDILEDEFG